MKREEDKYLICVPFLVILVTGIIILLMENPRMLGVIILFTVLIFLVCLFFYKLFENSFFNNKSFNDNKNKISKYIKDCSDLMEHINETKIKYNDMFTNEKIGSSFSIDESKYSYKRKELTNDRFKTNVYNCSLNIVKKAEEYPFIYACKYFNIDKSEEMLETVEEMLNDFLSIEDGMKIIEIQKNKIFDNLHIPHIIQVFSEKRINEEIGFPCISFNNDYFPKLIFKYVSAGGNSSRSTCIIFNIENTEQFIKFLSLNIQKRKSQKYQRQLMTSKLRNEIKERDNYTCQKCGVSISQEPHLLLEIDHIIPVSKGGITCRENLQTLCWKCNRSKSNKLYNK